MSATAPKPPTNLAGRMGRWSARHRKIAIFGWLAFVIVAFAIGTRVGLTEIDPATSGPGESGRAAKILDAGFKQPAGESVLVQSRSLVASDPAFDAAVRDVVSKLVFLDQVTNIRSPRDPANAGQISQDGHSALVEFQIRGDADTAADRIDPVISRIEAAQRAHPELFIGQFGDGSADKALNEKFGQDLARAGLLSVPVTLIILIVAFGALVAAGIPLLLGITAVIATMGLLAFGSKVLPVDPDSVLAIVLLIGLAVGVDYSMFYLKREREERAAGRTEEAALEVAAATSGRSVLISGLTVMVALAGMFLSGDKFFASFAMATMLVVAVAMIGSLTVLPAVLSKLGDNVDRLRVPFVGRLRRDDGEGRIWGAIIDRVLRRPVLAAVLSAGLLLALAAPALQLRAIQPGPDTFPKIPVMTTYDRIQAAFPGSEIPANVVVQAPDIQAPAVQQAIADLRQQALASGQMHEPIAVDVNSENTVANISIPVDGEGTDDASNAALATLRNTIMPATIGALPNVESGVAGVTAESKDFNALMKAKLPIVIAFVLAFAFLLMLFAFRSLVIATKAIVLNLLSVGAAYGVLVIVFQHGVGKGILGFESTAGIDAVLPMLLFVILFGLSMDYHVFILSRIRETYDRGATTDEAIAHGIKTTAGVVTSAAVVMVFVFAIFGTLSIMILKQFGVGLATAILIDATVVRAVLLPASMKLLGDWNWYLPSWLDWLPHLEHGGPVEPPVEPAPPAPPGPPALGPTG